MNPQNTQTTQRNPNNSLLCALGASAIPMYSPSVETDPVDRPLAVLLALQTARFTQANKGNQGLVKFCAALGHAQNTRGLLFAAAFLVSGTPSLIDS